MRRGFVFALVFFFSASLGRAWQVRHLADDFLYALLDTTR